jgi:hypothetical protein
LRRRCCYINPEGGLPGWEGGALMATVSKDESVRIWDTASGECLCVHTEEGCGMWTAVRSWAGAAGGGAGGEDAGASGRFNPHLVATTYMGGIYVYEVVAGGGFGITLNCLNMVRPIVEEDYDLSEGVPHPADL